MLIKKKIKCSSHLFGKVISQSSSELMFLKREEKLDISVHTRSVSFSQKKLDFVLGIANKLFLTSPLPPTTTPPLFNGQYQVGLNEKLNQKLNACFTVISSFEGIYLLLKVA